jgi:hypothetical protein
VRMSSLSKFSTTTTTTTTTTTRIGCMAERVAV